MKLINPYRLALLSLILGAFVLPMYFLVLRDASKPEPGFSNAVLLATNPPQGQKVGLRPGELAPDFEISTSQGERLRLSSMRGKPVLITFYALWCTSCLSEMPDIKAVQEERGLDRLTVLAINAGESRNRALEFIDLVKAPFAWGLDFDLTVSDAYGVFGLPYTVYLDASGTVRAVYAGLADKARLNAYVDAAFKASEPPALPPRLRTVSSIPRERVLNVESAAPGTLVFTSRSLRCDASYCATEAIEQVKAYAGVRALKPGAAKDGVPALDVSFDPQVIDEAAVIKAVANALQGLRDPVYETALVVQIEHR